jgi:molybdopterin/thiamine biosynthesis adenylyltransferase
MSTPSPREPSRDFSDTELLRYGRHLMLDDIGVEGQRRLLASHALVIGAGGLGSPVGLFLAASGVGRLTVIDHDTVELSNLQRQIAHSTARIGQPKADSLKVQALALNPGITIRTLARRADAALLDELVPGMDLVLDCSDNFRTRHAVNAACVRHGVPLVAGAAIGLDAQLGVYHPAAGAPCYGCLFPPEVAHEDVACATMGVLAPLVGLVGSAMAIEALKLLAGFGTPLAGRLLMLDARRMAFDEIQVARQKDCTVCGHVQSRAETRPE